MEIDENSDDDWMDDEEDDFLNQPIVQALTKNQTLTREALFDYLLKQDYTDLPSELALQLSRIFFLFNDQSSLSRFAINIQFQTQLWEACSNFGTGPYGPIIDRITHGHNIR
jgi:hypothetical protein